MGSKIASILAENPPERGDAQNQQVCKFHSMVMLCLERLQEIKSLSNDKRK